MTPSDLLSPLVGDPSSDGTAQTLPEDPAWYVGITERFYNAYCEWRQTVETNKATREEFLAWHSAETQLIDELRFKLSDSGHTFAALLWVAEWASSQNDDSHLGINPLAAISCMLPDRIPEAYTASELFMRFENLMSNDELAHNARVCRDRIWREYPGMVSNFGGSFPRSGRKVRDCSGSF